MRVVLLRKIAEESMDGVDVRDCHVGDVLDLAPADADLLVAEKWAIRDRRRELNLVGRAGSADRRTAKAVHNRSDRHHFRRVS